MGLNQGIGTSQRERMKTKEKKKLEEDNQQKFKKETAFSIMLLNARSINNRFQEIRCKDCHLLSCAFKKHGVKIWAMTTTPYKSTTSQSLKYIVTLT